MREQDSAANERDRLPLLDAHRRTCLTGKAVKPHFQPHTFFDRLPPAAFLFPHPSHLCSSLPSRHQPRLRLPTSPASSLELPQRAPSHEAIASRNSIIPSLSTRTSFTFAIRVAVFILRRCFSLACRPNYLRPTRGPSCLPTPILHRLQSLLASTVTTDHST